MNRTDIIQLLIKNRKYTRYLEITSKNDLGNYNNVQCQYKKVIQVDVNQNDSSTSDKFFRLSNERFDLILIDGLHTEEQTLKDMRNSLKCLSKNGVLVVHDCLPPDKWHQRSIEDYKEGESWNGKVWKAMLRFINSSNYTSYIIDTDWGCGIIDTSGQQSVIDFKLPENLDYQTHFHLLSNFVISPEDFTRSFVLVFYHLACMGNWIQVFQEQMLALSKNGFKKIKLTVLGSNEDLELVNNICVYFKMEVEIVFQTSDLQVYETPSIKAIQEYARKNEGYVLYLHSKGVSNPADRNKAKWRRLMMHELIEKWKDFILSLRNYDVIGVNWCDMPPISHFSGNFWYASTQYLRKLPDFQWYYENPQYQIWDYFHYKRLTCEFWIGSSKHPPKVLSLAFRNVNFCEPVFWSDK